MQKQRRRPELDHGYPEMTMLVMKRLGWDKDLTVDELAAIQRIGGKNVDAVSWATDLSGGIQRVCLDHGVCHYGNGKARAYAWNVPDPVPIHREPIYTPRPDLVAKYPTRPDERQFRIPNIGFTVQKAAVDRGIARDQGRQSGSDGIRRSYENKNGGKYSKYHAETAVRAASR